MKEPTVYIITNKDNSTLYIGSTTKLTQTIYQYKSTEESDSNAGAALDKLVFFEPYGTMEAASLRENMLKNWCRDLQDELITAHNPNWRDLFPFLA